MTSYNVRIGEGTDLNVGVHPGYKAADHSVRLLRMSNGDLIIGTVVQADPNTSTAVLTLPMHVDVEYCEDHDEEEVYEFIPYLRNMIPFDIQKPQPVTFNLAHCVNAAEPSTHLVRNYYRVLLMHKAVSDEIHGLREPTKETMH